MSKNTTVFYDNIGEFSQKLGLPASTLRYYEQQGLLQPQRKQNGCRYYTEEDMFWMTIVLHLKATGMTITELKRYTNWHKTGDRALTHRLTLLKDTKKRFVAHLQMMQHHLQILNDKINWYEDQQANKSDQHLTFEDYLKQLGHEP